MTEVDIADRIIGEVKTKGVMQDERIDHARINVLKTPRRIPDLPLPPHNGVALVACYGPSLRMTYPLLKKQRKKLGGTIISVSGAHDFLRSKGITPDIHVECDPRAHKGKMIRKETALAGAGVPLHPGAEKFYKEIGLIK